MSTDTKQTSALDYVSLRQQGIAWLEKLAGSEWTDFNAHDPGITILEQLCYALSDLSYRIDYNIEDLLSKDGEDTNDSLYLPKQILVSKPVTLLDLRKTVIDIEGVKNVWFEPVDGSQMGIFYNDRPPFADDHKVINLTGGEGAVGLALQGLYRVLIEKSPETARDNDAIIKDVSLRLHNQRALGVDFDVIQILASQLIPIAASITLDINADPETVYLKLLEGISAYISPSVRFYTLQQRLADGNRIDEIFEGPLLNHGFIDDKALIQLKRKKNLFASELIRTMMDVEGVHLVEFVAFKDGDALNDTGLILDTGKAPKFDIFNSTLTLKKRQLPLQLDTGTLNARYFTNQQLNNSRQADPELPHPQGRDRRIANYYSIMHQFPRAYGVGETGLPLQASEQRKSQVKQLKAYLLLFDQFLANSFTQLAKVRDLFSFGYNDTTSYFAAQLDAPGINEIWQTPDQNDRQQRLQEIFGASIPQASGANNSLAAEKDRRNRFLDHLLARFGEQFVDYGNFLQADDSTKSSLLTNKVSLLRNYALISAAKGSGFNVLIPPSLGLELDNSGLEQVLRLKLGITAMEKLCVIEHGLLRPMPGDANQQGPVLTNAYRPDPYSMQLTVMLFSSRPGSFQPFVEQMVRSETPAHIKVTVQFPKPEDTDNFARDFDNWRRQLSAYRTLTNNSENTLNGPVDNSATIPLREARDRIIEWLGLGQTYPLRDLKVTDSIIVAFGIKAVITINNSQVGVRYSLCDDQHKPLNPNGDNPELTKDGNGGNLELLTPDIDDNRIFSIQATKLSNGLVTMLLQNTAVLVGLDLNLKATIQNAPFLLPTGAAADDDRIVGYGEKVSVAIDESQEGVDYQLVKVEGKKETALSDPVRGDTKTILLATKDAVTEDFDIRIRATKKYDKSQNKQTETDLLTAVLPLKVKANPALGVAIVNTVIDYSANAAVTVQASQSNVQYQALIRTISDREFIHGKATGEAISMATGAQQQPVTLSKPAISGFSVATQLTQGKKGDLVLNLSGQFTEDTYVSIQAVKTHAAKGGQTIISTVNLNHIAAVLVRPDPNPPLRFSAKADNSMLQEPIQVSGGQSGVFYEFTTLADNKVLGQPVYFHQRDRDDTSHNKGIGQLQTEVDFVIWPSLSAGTLSSVANFTSRSLTTPELSAGITLPTDANLSIRAYKAQSRVEITINRKVTDLLVNP